MITKPTFVEPDFALVLYIDTLVLHTFGMAVLRRT